MIPWIDEVRPVFPSVKTALKDPEGLLCAGGNLSIDTLLDAYSQGIFPWYSDGQPLLWWSTDPRMVLTPRTYHESRSLKRFLRKSPWTVTSDTAFNQVIDCCASIVRSHEDGTWIHPEMQEAYCLLHKDGHAHSIEVWDDQGQLAGGLYGVAIGRAFFGESMFSSLPNGSRVALNSLMKSECYDLVDCQMHTPHLERQGGQLMLREEFLNQIKTLTQQPPQSLPQHL